MRIKEFLNEETELERIIKLSGPNEWITHGPFELYIRVGNRFIEEKEMKVIDLASFQITDKKERGKGHFSRLLKLVNDLGKKYGYDGIYVESILNPDLITILDKKNFRIVTQYDPPSMYREIQ